jgi:hypothetical protein
MSDSINKMINKIKTMDKQRMSAYDITQYFIYTERIKYNMNKYKSYYN